TLELLEELLQDYNGTVLLVSHDRAFLDNVVTQTLVAEGDGVWGEYVGGYDDWLAQRREPEPVAESRSTAVQTAATEEPAAKKPATPARPRPQRGGRLSSWEAKELESLPDAIAEVEAQQEALTARLSDPTLYQEKPERVAEINEELAALEDKLSELFDRWEVLEAK